MSALILIISLSGCILFLSWICYSMVTNNNSQTSRQHIAEFKREINQFCESELPIILDRNSNTLFYNLSKSLANGIIYEVFVPRIEAWRDSRIESLNNLEADILTTARAWLQRGETTRKIESLVITWLRDEIAPEIDREVKQICNRYGIPEQSFNGKLNNALNADSRGFGGEISVADQLAEAVGYFSNVLLFSLFAGTTALSTLIFGPVGLIISVLVGLVGGIVGKSAVESWVKEANLWPWIRQGAISENKIREISRNQCPNVEEKIKMMFNQDQKIKQNLIDPLSVFLTCLVKEM
jgi:uncharacterized membrane protein YeaQ/YmgE (transglycosylase-associated protein family)